MALQKISDKSVATKIDKRSHFENRLRLIAERVPGIKSKDDIVAGYTRWRIFCDYLVIRTFPTKLTIHTNGDITHYECKEMRYEDVKFECEDLVFIANLLENK